MKRLYQKKHDQFTGITNIYSLIIFLQGLVYRRLIWDAFFPVNISKKRFLTLFGPHCESHLNRVKLHLLCYLLEYLEGFGKVLVPIDSPNEHFNCIVKKAYMSTSNRFHTTTKETVNYWVKLWRDITLVPLYFPNQLRPDLYEYRARPFGGAHSPPFSPHIRSKS